MGVEVVYVSNLAEVMGKIDQTAKARMLEAARDVHAQTVKNLTGNRSGRTYNVPGTHKKYAASAPGEMPASATGTLRKSVKWGVEGQEAKVVGYVGTDVKYGPMLEFGTSKMLPRPWLRPTFEQMQGKIQEIFRRVWF